MVKRSIILIIVVCIILSPLYTQAEEIDNKVGEETKAEQEVEKENLEGVSELGEKLGYEKGKQVGLANASKYPPVDIKEVTPTLEDILRDNPELDIESEEYVEEFVKGYLKGFEEAYKESQVKIDYGMTLGRIKGSQVAYRVVKQSGDNDWERYMPTDTDIIKEFNLNKDTELYRNNFISAYKHGYQVGYEESFEKYMYSDIVYDYGEGTKDGVKVGKTIGEYEASKDYYSKNKLDVNRNMPSDETIIKKYLVYTDSKEYTSSFLIGFKDEYKTSYTRKYRDLTLDSDILDETRAFDNGKEIGGPQGETKALNDYMSGSNNNWERHIINNSLIKEYDLVNQSEDYKEKFISGYREAFSISYKNKYSELITSNLLVKTTTEIVPLEGLGIQTGTGFNLDILPGTLYNPVVVNIKSMSNIENTSNIFGNIMNMAKYKDLTGLIPTSQYYQVKIVNKTNIINDDYKMSISFDYYGDNKAGVYKLKDNKWEYIKSEIEENKIKAEVTPSKADGIYAVLVDTNWVRLYDIRGSWAKEQIDTFVRRKILNGYPDGTFKPDKEITREEFIIVLSRLFDWVNEEDWKIKKINTFKDIKQNNDIINYAVTKGYLKGYPDNTFRPRNNITYKEAEIIINRITKEFKWKTVANQMKNEDSHRSNSYDGMGNNISRSEVVYVLHYIFCNE